MNKIAARFFARDLAVMIALSDARKAENEAARARCKANAALVAELESHASRRGKALDWDDYFRNIGI